ncbi:hypothetical protein J2T18_003550 [Paenibacillus polymyxa]|uniref:hypothetical protein n=1 Tax=Paenibacillus polymyxa TaxID=1406 RepID=UPI00278FF5D2|nr:hypothetical protein [Paenibacillus polymyxa]MDQ0049249.1 hypothetical protein [Paenibacillus polymyxa]
MSNESKENRITSKEIGRKGDVFLKIVNLFDAVRDRSYNEFLEHYDGEVNQINATLGLNLLNLALVNGKSELSL